MDIGGRGSGISIQGSGFGVNGLVFGVWGCRVQGLRFRVDTLCKKVGSLKRSGAVWILGWVVMNSVADLGTKPGFMTFS